MKLSQKKRQIPYVITYIWNLKYGTNELRYKTETDSRCREQTCGCQGGRGGRGMDWEFGVGRCQLLHLEWISNEVLLYSRGNYVQSLVTEYDKK